MHWRALSPLSAAGSPARARSPKECRRGGAQATAATAATAARARWDWPGRGARACPTQRQQPCPPHPATTRAGTRRQLQAEAASGRRSLDAPPSFHAATPLWAAPSPPVSTAPPPPPPSRSMVDSAGALPPRGGPCASRAYSMSVAYLPPEVLARVKKDTAQASCADDSIHLHINMIITSMSTP